MRLGIQLLILIIGLGWYGSGLSVTSTNDVDNLLSSLGFQRVQTHPIDFSLPDIEGKEHTLSSFKDKWVLLAFWATWCGPCTYELPQLESIYQEFKSEGLVVVGVNVDQGNSQEVESFLKSKRISFPQLLDSNGKVSRMYQAVSIPIIYAISPQWVVAGVLKGAREWEDRLTLETIKKLLKAPLTGPVAGKTQAPPNTPQEALQLPEELEPPSIQLTLPEQPLYRGQSPNARIEISWKGNMDKYLIKVPRIEVPGKIEKGSISSSTSSHEGASVLRYYVPLKSKDAGVFRIGPIELAYMPRAGGQEQFTRLEGQDLEFKKRPTWTLYTILIFVVFLGLGLFFWAWRLKKKLPSPKKNSSLESLQHEFKHLMEKKIHRSRDDYAASLLELLLKLHPEKNHEKDSKLSQLLEKCRYGGLSLSEEQIRSYEKMAEKTLSDPSQGVKT